MHCMWNLCFQAQVFPAGLQPKEMAGFEVAHHQVQPILTCRYKIKPRDVPVHKRIDEFFPKQDRAGYLA